MMHLFGHKQVSTNSSLVCGQRRGHRRVPTACLLVTTALTAELQAKENLQDKRELSTTSNSTEREKSVSVDTIYILRPSHAF